jgi:segregation and condensation protein B
MQDAKNRVEAVLFTTGRFLKLEDLSKLTSIGSVGYLKQVLQDLKEDYDKKRSSLEIVNEKDLWRLNIRKEFLYLTESLLSDAELDKPTQETLAIIAYRQPAIQSDVTNIRGNKSYDHIKKLKEEGFLISERFGRTRILKLTQKFYDYFDVVEDSLQTSLDAKKLFNDVKKEE